MCLRTIAGSYVARPCAGSVLSQRADKQKLPDTACIASGSFLKARTSRTNYLDELAVVRRSVCTSPADTTRMVHRLLMAYMGNLAGLCLGKRVASLVLIIHAYL